MKVQWRNVLPITKPSEPVNILSTNKLNDPTERRDARLIVLCGAFDSNHCSRSRHSVEFNFVLYDTSPLVQCWSDRCKSRLIQWRKELLHMYHGCLDLSRRDHRSSMTCLYKWTLGQETFTSNDISHKSSVASHCSRAAGRLVPLCWDSFTSCTAKGLTQSESHMNQLQ